MAVVERHKRPPRDEVRKKLDIRGRERALIYQTAVYTGLRLGEIASLRPCHLELDLKPFPRVDVPGKFTKNGKRAELLVPSFVGDLGEWIAETKKGPDDPRFHVPQASVRIMRKDLELAGTPYRTTQGEADFHSLRLTSNVMPGPAGIPPRVHQHFMRHSDVRLTLGVYDDESFLTPEAVKAMDGVGPKCVNEKTRPGHPGRVDGCDGFRRPGATAAGW